MSLFREKITAWDEDGTNNFLLRSFFYFLLVGIAGMIYALYASLKIGNWSGAITVALVFLIFLTSLYFFYNGKAQTGFRLIAIGGFIIIVLRITIFLGIDNLAFYTIYPLAVMISILFREKPAYISLLTLLLVGWLVGLYWLATNRFYAGQNAPMSIQTEIILIAISLILMLFILQITARNSLIANRRLVKAREDALEAQTQAEASNRAKSTFLANMSHELRTPLNAIIGYSEMISEESDGDIQEDSIKIERSAKSLLNIINSILEISKIETGKLELLLTEFKINSLLDEVTLLIEPQMRSKENQFEVEIDSLNHKLITDRQKLSQILINLLSNANKFTHAGKIKLKVRQVGEMTYFFVIDTGIGIPETSQQKIFQPFQQVETEINRRYDGAGLGLAICKQFAELMQGDLTVESELGKGSTFILSLPSRLTA